jgi:Zn-dependent protease
VKYVGTIGAAVATVAMLYLWCVPFNLACIAKGYRTHFLRALPWRRMAGVLVAALVAAVASGTVLAFGSIPPGLRVLTGFLLFGTLYLSVGYALRTEVRVVANEIIGRLRVRGGLRKVWS